MSRENSEELVVDAFGGGVKEDDYTYLMTEFGIERIQNLLPEIHEPHYYMTRGVMFGHTDLGRILEAIQKKRPFAVMTGIKPSSYYHLGSFITATEVIYFQSLGAHVSFCIADLESYADGRQTPQETTKYAIDNIADVLALGLDPKRAYIYRQSEDMDVLRLGSLFAAHVTYNMMKGLYGERSFGHYHSALIQAGDILLPQLERFGGPKPTVTPVGADQAPHARLTRDLAKKEVFQNHYRFVPSGFTFHLLLKGLDGSDKMSKRTPMSFFNFQEEDTLIKQKMMNAFTGGRDTVEEQRQLGGRPDICRNFDLGKFFFIPSDKELTDLREECMSGRLLCGECKLRMLERVLEFKHRHNAKKEKLQDLARVIVLGE